MNINATLWGQMYFSLALVVIYLTIRFAKGSANNLALVVFYSCLLNFIFPPGGWLYCFYWFRRSASTQINE